MQYRKLGQTGLSVSVVGFGASPLGDVYGQTDPLQIKTTVDFAIDHGVNFFDVSPFYGVTLAESRLGEALAGSRQKVLVATKCGRYDMQEFDFSRKRIIAGFDESLRRLRTDYVDLLQAHDIEFGDRRQIEEETLPALRDLQKQGKARFIGITSYQLSMMAAIAASSPLDTVLSYCRFNLLINDLDDLLLPVVQAKGIGLINASPLHMGLLAGESLPPWHPAPSLKDAAAQYKALCASFGVNPGQFALRFCLDHPYAASTLIGMFTVKQVADAVGAISLKVDPELLFAVQKLFEPVHNIVWPSGLPANFDYQTNPVAH